MAVTLAQAKVNSQDDVTYEVIDEFQKQDAFLDAVTFDDTVTPGTGGGSLTYSWNYLQTERGAGPRDYNTNTEKQQAIRQRKSADLIPYSAAFDVDRVLGQLGPAATNEISLQTEQAIKSVRAAVNDSFVNGGQNSDSSFDGLDALLTASGREVFSDWTAVSSEDGAHSAIDALDDALSQLDGDPTFILGNRQGILRLRSIARRAGYYARERDEFGRQVESYAGVPFMDMGAKAGSSTPVIPVESGVDSGDGTANDTLTNLYIVRLGLDAFHGASMAGAPLVTTLLPNFDTAGAVKEGEVEMGPVAAVLKADKSAIRLRIGLNVQA